MMNGDEVMPTEDVVNDMDILDTELQDVKLHVTGEDDDAIFKEVIQTGSHRTRLIYAGVVFACLIGIAATLATLGKRSNVSTQNSGKHGKDHSDKHPAGDLDNNQFYVCTASSLTCDSKDFAALNYTAGSGWLQAGTDIIGEGTGDLSGRSIALSCNGGVIAVGAPRHDDNTGHARVYAIDPATQVWTQMGGDIDGVAEKDQAGTAVALSADGHRVAVGAALHDGSGENAGHVRVLAYNGIKWNLLGQEIYGEGVGDQSGRAIALSGSGHRLVVGGSGNNATGDNAGHARVYEYNEASAVWEQLGADLDGQAARDFFGKAVAISGDGQRIAVGGHKNDGQFFLTDVGHVMVFEYSNGVWEQVGNELKGVTNNAWFGHTVSLNDDGTILAVGAPGDSAIQQGETPVFILSEGNWKLLGAPLWGGYAVDLSSNGHRLISASPYNHENGPSSGAAVVSEWNGTDWSTVGEKLLGLPNDLSGTSVAISGDGMRMASSSPGNDFFEQEDVGFVRVFDNC